MGSITRITWMSGRPLTDESDQHGVAGPNLPAHSRRTSTPTVRVPRLHRSQPCGRRLRWSAHPPHFGYSNRVHERALDGVSAGQGPFQHVVAGEGFEPSKLSRWIYSAWATTR